MVKLYDNERGNLLGEISEEQLDLLFSLLEEESTDDTDYYLNRETLELLREQGADAGFLDLLSKALDGNGEGEIRWSDE